METDRSSDTAPRLRSICVGGPREVEWRGDVYTTSIFKEPVTGRVRVYRLNLAGDKQSDLTVHGGPDKAVYAYPSEHYPYWHQQLPDFPLPWGAFGENFTTDGLIETEICIGDRLRIGSAEFVVTQPRMPCYKLGIRFDRADMVKRFLHAGRSGFYLRVLEEGEVGAGDAITLAARGERGVSVADIVTLYTAPDVSKDLLRRAIDLPALPRGWRERFRQRLSLIAD
ncbi:MAG TPA: MOSC domain-containing protein [Gemmatimonadaceae bacterium]|nr:MOSC domain-containing protein [Gemmatimonadaceae bacterium]